MILYLIHDLQQNTYSHPLVGPDLGTVNQSLLQLNPENLSDLKVVVLDTLETLDDLLKLRVIDEHSIPPLKKSHHSQWLNTQLPITTTSKPISKTKTKLKKSLVTNKSKKT